MRRWAFRRSSDTSMKAPSCEVPALGLNKDAERLDLPPNLPVHLVDPCEERSELIPTHKCNRRSPKQVAKRQKFAQDFDKIYGDHCRPGVGWCGHLGHWFLMPRF